MGCTFCATGSMGFKSNLTSGEIVEQLVHASRLADIRNIVFMVYCLLMHLIKVSFWLSLVVHTLHCVSVSMLLALWQWYRCLSILSVTMKYIFTSCCLCFADCDQGMGEPLNNYNAVVEAVRAMLKQPFQLSPKRITISTVSTMKATS